MCRSTVPTKVEVHGDDLTASGEFELTHTTLGMMPFTVMLGALQVADNMKFVYRDPRSRCVAVALSRAGPQRAPEVTAIPSSLTVT